MKAIAINSGIYSTEFWSVAYSATWAL